MRKGTDSDYEHTIRAHLIDTFFRRSYEEFADTKWISRIHQSNNRQHNGQKKNRKKTNNDLQSIHIKPKIM